MHAQLKALGDFQTPLPLANDICSLIARNGFAPATALEPTCGIGNFILALLETFPQVSYVLGVEINPDHVAQARARLSPRADIRQADLLAVGLANFVKELQDPILIIGNPPWVTLSTLGTLSYNNRPKRANPDRLRGLDSLTGKSNFDISEWIIRECLQVIQGRTALMAMVCKTSVARKALLFAWRNNLRVCAASLYLINAKLYFSTSVDACLLLVRTGDGECGRSCNVFPSLHSDHPTQRFSFLDGMLVADAERYAAHRHLLGRGNGVWRSGMKHDCADVFEMRRLGDEWINRRGERARLEDKVVYPFLKASDLGRPPQRWVLVPGRDLRDDQDALRERFPLAYDYLLRHIHLLAKRKSSVYKGRSAFSIFGIGPYTFAPWKVAISGLHKRSSFFIIPPFQGLPVILDDTCYFIPCLSEEEAQFLHMLLSSDLAQEFLSSLIFWDAKRPITAGLLHSLDLPALSRALGRDEQVIRAIVARRW